MNDGELKRYVDTQEALARIRGNTRLFKMLLTTFVENSYFGQLQREIEAGQYEDAAKTTHAIKGSAANLSLKAIYELSQSLETALKGGEDATEIFSAFSAAYEETLRAIDTVIKELPA